MEYTYREIEVKVLQYLENFPVVGITGPRQSGKSTLLKHLLPNYQYITFDDYKTVDLFYEDPEGFMQKYHNQVIFDEAQKVPEIFNYLKIAVDNDRQNYGKFVVTGSSQFTLVQNISESLAGRIGLLSLFPLQFSELPSSAQSAAIYKGSYPELVLRNYTLSSEWYSSYLDTYVNKDVRSLANIGDLRDFRRFLAFLAANIAQILNLSSCAKELGVSVPTLKRWLSVLEASYIIFLLPAYFNNLGKRIVKSPKLYFCDTGLAAYLVGIETEEAYSQGPMAGSFFENYIVSEVMKRETHHKTHAELFYLRTSNDVEIDLIIDRKRYKEFIEIKKTSTFKVTMIKPIKQILQENDKGYLIYTGNKFDYSDTIIAIPYRDYLAANNDENLVVIK